MKITALIENTSHSESIQPQHGLSLYIEANGRRLLFDMGQDELLLKNADALGISLANVELAILSHGHYDHGGGLRAFLQVNQKAPVYVSKHAFGDFYNGTEKYIGLDKEFKKEPRLILTEGVTPVADGFCLYSQNHLPRPHSFGSFGLTERTEQGFAEDPFLHEQYLLIEEDGKRVLISGCSHKGILDIVDWFCPDVLIGGFHFSKLPLNDTLAHAAQALNRFPTRYYTCHCTGEAQFAYMKNFMDRLHPLSCGETIQI